MKSTPPAQSTQQLSQIEKSVTHLLVATKQLLETLTLWSRHNATESEVSDVYVRLGYEFNIACRAFTSIGVEVSDLGNVPDLLRSILEDTLSQDASPASLDRYLPRIRDIIINLLHGLKRKQQRLRQKQPKDGASGSGTRNGSVGSITPGEPRSADTDGRSDLPLPGAPNGTDNSPDSRFPARTLSSQDRRPSPPRQDGYLPSISRSHSGDPSQSSSSRPIQMGDNPAALLETNPEQVPAFPPPPPPPKQHDALTALQRGGDLERRASRRYSAYQISKHLGTSNGVPMLPVQNSPIPNRGREARESMNAVRTRGSFIGHNKQRSLTTINTEHPSDPAQHSKLNDTHFPDPPRGNITSSGDDSPTTKTPDDKLGAGLGAGPLVSATITGLPPTLPGIPMIVEGDAQPILKPLPSDPSAQSSHSRTLPADRSPSPSPQQTTELTLFLQYKSKVKKFVLPNGYAELTFPRLQLAFIEKFAWNTHSNGVELPDIYVQDSVSGIRHELEDLSDVKDRSVLVLNVEVLDEVKKHFDDGLTSIRTTLDAVRSTVESQQASLQRVSDRQQDTAKDMARIAATPTPSTRTSALGPIPSKPAQALPAAHLDEVQSLRRDLAVMRQTYSGFVSDLDASMGEIRKRAGLVRTTAVKVSVPATEGAAGRAYLNSGREAVVKQSASIVERAEDLQDIVEDLRRDVVTRGVRPLPRQLETVGRDIATLNLDLRRFNDHLSKEKPVWSKIWEAELAQVCDDRKELDIQEEIYADLEADLANAAEVFALVEQHTKQLLTEGAPLNSASQPGGQSSLRSTSRTLPPLSTSADPHAAKEGVLGEVRALSVNHENRLEAIERAERNRQRELESRRGGEFQKELGSFVDEGKLKKTGGAEETERRRKAKDDSIRKEVWERMNGVVVGGEDEAAETTGSPEAEFVEAVEEHA
ncbi:MAG: Bud site selection protein 6 [Vezdaea aestivalis]|nr:MAG: Bud site selection protein 6 [Vezdaea aestivalis]